MPATIILMIKKFEISAVVEPQGGMEGGLDPPLFQKMVLKIRTKMQ